MGNRGGGLESFTAIVGAAGVLSFFVIKNARDQAGKSLTAAVGAATLLFIHFATDAKRPVPGKSHSQLSWDQLVCSLHVP